MNEAYLRVVGVVGGKVPKVPGYGMNQRSVEVATSWMYHHTGRLVDDHKVVVLIAHVEGQLFGHDGSVEVRTVEHERDDIADTNLIVALYRTVVHMEKPCLGSLLYAVTRGVLRVLGQIFVYAQRLLPTVYFQPQMLIELTARLA